MRLALGSGRPADFRRAVRPMQLRHSSVTDFFADRGWPAGGSSAVILGIPVVTTLYLEILS